MQLCRSKADTICVLIVLSALLQICPLNPFTTGQKRLYYYYYFNEYLFRIKVSVYKLYKINKLYTNTFVLTCPEKIT